MPQLIASKCGHATNTKGEVKAFGDTTTTEMPVTDGVVEYCLDCISAMACKCAWCGHAVFIGDAVTLYGSRGPDFVVPEHAVVYGQSPIQLVGCLRWDCADTGADRAGFRLPDDQGNGHVVRTQSLYAVSAAAGPDTAVLVNNLSNASEVPTVLARSAGR